jgi:hypothetical protein
VRATEPCERADGTVDKLHPNAPSDLSALSPGGGRPIRASP